MRTSSVRKDLDRSKLALAFCGLVDLEANYHGHGNFGTVVDNHDGTVTKLFFREDGLGDNQFRFGMYKNEINAFRLLSGTALSTVQLPELIDDYGEIDHPRVLAAFRMSKMDGRVIPKTEFDSLSQDQKDQFYQDIGTLLGTFHAQATDQIGRMAHDIELNVHQCEIEFFSEFPGEYTRAFIIANRAYTQQQIPTIQHGDLHLGNIIRGEDNTPQLSLIDFGTLGAVSDSLLDVVNIGNNCNDTTTPDRHMRILDAYNAARGTNFGEESLLLSRLATSVGRLKNGWHNAERRADEMAIIDEIMPKIVNITGFIPQLR